MKNAVHQDLAAGRWQTLTISEQLGNIGSEVSRALKAKRLKNHQREESAIDRALELFDLTIADPRHRKRLRELCRAREVVCDFFSGENSYAESPESLDRYFTQFALYARAMR